MRLPCKIMASSQEEATSSGVAASQYEASLYEAASLLVLFCLNVPGAWLFPKCAFKDAADCVGLQ